MCAHNHSGAGSLRPYTRPCHLGWTKQQRVEKCQPDKGGSKFPHQKSACMKHKRDVYYHVYVGVTRPYYTFTRHVGHVGASKF